MNTQCKLLWGGIGALASFQAVVANDLQSSGIVVLAQAKVTAGAAGAGAGAAARPGPATGQRAPGVSAPAAGTAGAAGAGAGAAAGAGPVTGRANAGTAADAAGTNSSVTVNDPANDVSGNSSNGAGTASGVDPPASAATNGVTVGDPLSPNAAGSLDNPVPAGTLPADRQRLRDGARANRDVEGRSVNPDLPGGRRAATPEDQQLESALRSCDSLPDGEKTACHGEARRLHGRM